jgi:RNA polymerase sigma-70 factor (ECF subfamily)
LRQDFASAYEQHVLDVYGFLAYRVRSRADAEDLTQATFERALAAWPQYDPQRGSARTWLLAIARNVMVDHHRRGPGRAEEPVDALTVGRDLLVDFEEPSWGLDRRLAAALEGLAQRDREIVALRFGADLSGPEIAELVGLSLANVQQILSRSLRRLRDALEAAGVEGQPRWRYGASGPAPAAPSAARASRAVPESA